MSDAGAGHYRGLVIDFGGVLTTSIADAFRAFCEREGIDYERLQEILRSAYAVGTEPDAIVALMETGRMERTEFERQMAEGLSRERDRPVDPTDLLSRMLSTIHFDVPMVEAVLVAHRRGIRTCLLSNSWGVDTYPRDLLAELFDQVVISGEIGLRKPDPEVFELAARRLDLGPGECIFVDDISGNVEAAERVGMRGVVHEDAATTVTTLEELLGVDLTEPGGAAGAARHPPGTIPPGGEE